MTYSTSTMMNRALELRILRHLLRVLLWDLFLGLRWCACSDGSPDGFIYWERAEHDRRYFERRLRDAQLL
jgi:hypothetical protein